MADNSNSARDFAPRPVPEGLAPGLDLFVTTWLQQWVDAGGSVDLESNGRALIGWPEYHYSPACTEPSPDLPDSLREHQHAFQSAHYTGRIRAMLEMIETLPCGRDALKHHMLSHGIQHYHGRIGAES